MRSCGGWGTFENLRNWRHSSERRLTSTEETWVSVDCRRWRKGVTDLPSAIQPGATTVREDLVGTKMAGKNGTWVSDGTSERSLFRHRPHSPEYCEASGGRGPDSGADKCWESAGSRVRSPLGLASRHRSSNLHSREVKRLAEGVLAEARRWGMVEGGGGSRCWGMGDALCCVLGGAT